MSEVTQTRLHELFSYDPDTGVLRWKQTGRGRKKGNKAGSVGSHGYLAVSVDSKKYLNHRIIWLWMIGSWPEEQIDHIDKDRLNNKWMNLRDVSASTNMFNRDDLPSGSGEKFIYWQNHKKPWKVIVTQGRGCTSNLGSFKTKEEAVEIRNNFCEEHNIGY